MAYRNTSASTTGIYLGRDRFELISSGSARPVTRTLLIVAHPDDEIIGAGTMLRNLPGLVLCHVTDGAPRDLHDASRYGFTSASEYAQARRQELAAALSTAGLQDAVSLELNIADQQAAFQLVHLTRQINALILKWKPDVVLTHPYEGGHPDHDACAFATHAAVHLSGQATLCEFAGYHAANNGRFTANEFVSAIGSEIYITLTPVEQERKRQMFQCFTTQAETLSLFGTERECFRIAPRYNFCSPPHSGPLYYERFGWPMNGFEFQALADAARRSLALPEEAI